MRKAAIFCQIPLIAFVMTMFASPGTPAAEPSQDRVVVMYFHRTERCPTCQTMGSYAEEAVKTAFAEEIKSGQVAFHFINFEDSKNAKFAVAYQIAGPALIVAQVKDNKVASFRNLEDIWSKVSEKPAFLSYVKDSVREGLTKSK